MSGWPNLSELLVSADAITAVALVRAPLAAGSVTPGRCDLAPELLRATLPRIGRYDLETRRELATLIADHGDVELPGLTIEQATAPIGEAVSEGAARHELTLLVGGNNAVTRPGVLGLGLPLDQVGRAAPAAENFVATVAEVRRDGIARAIGGALAHVNHCEAIVVDCDIDVIDRSQ